jgi:hypothetical protein
LFENSIKANPLGLPFNTPVLWNIKSIFVIFPYLEKTWMRVYSSTVGARLPTYRRSGLPPAEEELASALRDVVDVADLDEVPWGWAEALDPIRSGRESDCMIDRQIPESDTRE